MTSRTATKRAGRTTPKRQKVKLDLACGQHKREGFLGVDIAPCEGVDVVHDLAVTPWPFDDRSVVEAHCSHFVEHVADLVGFMNELHRVCAAEAEVTIIHPFLKSTRAFQDPTHVRFIPDVTWWYFNLEWRKAQGLDHYPITADFDVVTITSQMNYPWNTRAPEAQQFAVQHYWDVVSDLVVVLKARK